MKAILKIGSFTMMTDLPPGLRSWFIMAPTYTLPGMASALEFTDIAQNPTRAKWEFEYEGLLYGASPDDTEAIALFKFVRES
jgi:hypothetical protein